MSRRSYSRKDKDVISMSYQKPKIISKKEQKPSEVSFDYWIHYNKDIKKKRLDGLWVMFPFVWPDHYEIKMKEN